MSTTHLSGPLVVGPASPAAPLVSGNGIEIVSGSLLLDSGSLSLTSGNATLSSGNLTLTSGNATLTSGNLTLTNGTIAAKGVTTSIMKAVLTTAGQAALATAGKVNVFTHTSATCQIRIHEVMVSSAGTNFSGGSGDRLLALSDGTTVYTVIPAASVQTLVNTRWGVTGVPYPASAGLNVLTAAGADLYLQYSGGSMDYTAGSINVIVTYELVTL